ncbi:Tol-Pal system beta propeller repeat protein TolB [Kushneria phosphatilytica]|uniref:Tol-Pal system protein TolB n=1 Tax=Kushneria phosphatilytica TaxID=657387 RepID=A0A1S1P0E0_9GAMM|nr:Tol-Pal system beta propeller repeat protein TolB [Kushneria phosphatilytica]OHV11945.1 Tol-Pal system beta propeller repeat protein TolB [Kushneria phosphatilytica]QEL11127.1 Tol-Pal system protein TolB [Kushneria phosphatilytica]
MKRLVALTGMVMMLMVSMMARAEGDLTIEITKGNDQAIPIAVVPFQSNGSNPPQDIAQIIRDDLQHSGQFSPLARNELISTPTSGDQIHYADWQQIKANYLVVGKIDRSGNGYKISWELHDVYGNKRMIGESVTSSADQLRSRAHYIADRIFKAITGIRGAFQTRIAYVSATGVDKNMHFALYVADQDGHNTQQILTSDQPIMSPAWSPDGKKLAYVSFESGRPAIYVQQLSTGRRIKLSSFKGINGAPAWSPDGRKLAMSLSRDGQPEIYVMDVASRSLTRMTQSSAIETEPDWSPDGSTLLFTSDRSGQPQLYTMPASGGSASRLTFTGNYNAGGQYGPEGKAVYMTTRTDQGFQVAKQNLESNRVTVLTSTGQDEAPAVAPNGTMVVYATQQGNQGVLGAASTDGRAEFVIPSPSGNVREPAWSPFLN